MENKIIRHWYAYGNKNIQLLIPEEFIADVAAGDEEALYNCMMFQEVKETLDKIDPVELARELKDFYGYDFVGEYLIDKKRIVSEACIDLDDGIYPIPVGAIHVGQEVYWNDPNRGISSGMYKVDEIISEDEGVIGISNGVSEVEVYFNELEF